MNLSSGSNTAAVAASGNSVGIGAIIGGAIGGASVLAIAFYAMWTFTSRAHQGHHDNYLVQVNRKSVKEGIPSTTQVLGNKISMLSQLDFST